MKWSIAIRIIITIAINSPVLIHDLSECNANKTWIEWKKKKNYCISVYLLKILFRWQFLKSSSIRFWFSQKLFNSHNIPHLNIHIALKLNLESPVIYPEVYVPMCAPQLGHEWFTLWHESIQYGNKQHGQHLKKNTNTKLHQNEMWFIKLKINYPTMHNISANKCAFVPVCVSTFVWMICLHDGQVIDVDADPIDVVCTIIVWTARKIPIEIIKSILPIYKMAYFN